MPQMIHPTPLEHWLLWFAESDDRQRMAYAVQHVTLADASLQPHLYTVEWKGWTEEGVCLHLPPEMMPAPNQPLAYLAFWDKADRQLRIEGRLQRQDAAARGGVIRIQPEVVEFWQGAKFRLHDRVVYRRQNGDEWATARLYP